MKVLTLKTHWQLYGYNYEYHYVSITVCLKVSMAKYISNLKCLQPVKQLRTVFPWYHCFSIQSLCAKKWNNYVKDTCVWMTKHHYFNRQTKTVCLNWVWLLTFNKRTAHVVTVSRYIPDFERWSKVYFF